MKAAALAALLQLCCAQRAAAVASRAEQPPAAASVAARTETRPKSPPFLRRRRRRWRASRLASRRSPLGARAPLPDARNCTWKTLTQKLDHFGGEAATFDQRLCVYEGFVPHNVSRILLYVGNESPVDEYVNNTGLMWEYGALRPGTLLVWAEHRYEARSTPRTAGVEACLSYCTVEQALADYALVVAKLHAAYGRTPVVAVGGSYGGMLAAWFRLKYPASVQGAIAASAPIWGLPLCRPPLNGGAVAVARAFGEAGGSEHCAHNLHGAFPVIAELGKTAAGRALLSERFRLCPGTLGTDQEAGLRLAEAVQGVFFDVAEANYPFSSTYITSAVGPGKYPLPSWPARVACEQLAAPIVAVHGGGAEFVVSVDGASVHVSWDVTVSDFFPRATAADLESMPQLRRLLDGARGAWGVWCNVTKQLTCFDPRRCDSSNGVANDYRPAVEPKSDTCSAQYAGGPASAWEPVVCNDDLNLVNYLHQGGDDGLYWPPNHAKGASLEDALGPVGTVGEGCAAPPGLSGYPATSDPWSRWLDAFFGGRSLEGYSNVIFSNGLLDPWSGAGVYDDASVLRPGAYTGPWLRNISSRRDVAALILPLGAHHLDLMFSDDKDPPEAPYARAVEYAAIDRWTR